MAIAGLVFLLDHQIFVQGDARDPLGVWVARAAVTGDASGGSLKVGVQVPAARSGSRIFTCYSAQVAGLTGTLISAAIKTRLLTNFPDADLGIGIQGFSTLSLQNDTGEQWNVSSGITAPIAGPYQHQIQHNDRFILLFGVSGADTTLSELEISDNVDGATYSFEWYGYFWDRDVLNTPGGPRHPGSG